MLNYDLIQKKYNLFNILINKDSQLELCIKLLKMIVLSLSLSRIIIFCPLLYFSIIFQIYKNFLHYKILIL